MGLPVTQKDGKKEQLPSDHFSTILLSGLFNESWHGKPCVQRVTCAAVIMPL